MFSFFFNDQSESVLVRLNRLSKTGVFVIALLVGLLVVLSGLVAFTLKQSDQAVNDVRVITRAKVDILNITLGAMDAIVDKEEGLIYPERQAGIDESFMSFYELLPTIEKVAGAARKADVSLQIKKDIELFDRSVRKGLVEAIGQRKGEEAFSELDDGIDGASERLMTELEVLSSSVAIEQKDMSNKMQIYSLASFATCFLVLVFSVLGFAF